MGGEIVFYDVASKLGPKGTNLNCWKIRLSLNYKGLKYRTVFVEFPDIEAKNKELGTPPTTQWPDGTGRYTLPVVVLPDGTAVPESVAIAAKLDEAYPETPRLLPGDTVKLGEEVQQRFRELVVIPSGSIIVDGLEDVLLVSRSYEYVRRRPGAAYSRAPAVGTLEREELWKRIESGWTELASYMDEKKALLNGNEWPVFADFVVVAHLIFMRYILSREEWSTHHEVWNDGRWAALLKGCEEYATHDLQP